MEIKVSIITISYNCCSEIEDTITSIIPLLRPDIEYLIIDGKSTDGTLDIINRYKKSISLIVSEKDNGIYDAMNKGMKLAHGQWCLFINAGDRLLYVPPHLLKDKQNEYSAIFCSVVSENGRIIRPHFNWRIRYKNTVPHQGAFYHIGMQQFHYNTNYKVFADYELNLRMYLSKCKIYLLSGDVVAFHSNNGISNDKRYGQESYHIIRKHCGIIFLLLSFLHKKKMGLKMRCSKILEIIKHS